MLVRGLSSKLYVGIERIKVGKELLGVFCLMNNKCVIHVPMSDPGWVGRGAKGSGFEVLHKQVGYYRAYGRSHSSP